MVCSSSFNIQFKKTGLSKVDSLNSSAKIGHHDELKIVGNHLSILKGATCSTYIFWTLDCFCLLSWSVMHLPPGAALFLPPQTHWLIDYSIYVYIYMLIDELCPCAIHDAHVWLLVCIWYLAQINRIWAQKRNASLSSFILFCFFFFFFFSLSLSINQSINQSISSTSRN